MKQYRQAAAALLLLCLSGCGKQTTSAAEEPAVPAFSPQITQTETQPAVFTEPAVQCISGADAALLSAETEILPDALDTAHLGDYFTAEPLSDTVFARINGISYQENPNIQRDDLRYLRVLHYTPAGEIRIGEMICNSAVSADLLTVFQGLYAVQYPIERMVLIDEYGGDDEQSMAANNTSCFNYRVIAGSTVLSNHAKGLAVDINPQYNPYVTQNADGTEHIEPENGTAFADRSRAFPMKIEHGDVCWQIFSDHGFAWGGDWDTPKDYQHFEKNG